MTFVIAGVTPHWPKVRVIDADTVEEIRYVIAADDQGGGVSRLALNEHGIPVYDPEKKGSIVIEEKRNIYLEIEEDEVAGVKLYGPLP